MYERVLLKRLVTAVLVTAVYLNRHLPLGAHNADGHPLDDRRLVKNVRRCVAQHIVLQVKLAHRLSHVRINAILA